MSGLRKVVILAICYYYIFKPTAALLRFTTIVFFTILEVIRFNAPVNIRQLAAAIMQTNIHTRNGKNIDE
jgi:hypothetical protein